MATRTLLFPARHSVATGGTPHVCLLVSQPNSISVI
jgi:hypothetical protein